MVILMRLRRMTLSWVLFSLLFVSGWAEEFELFDGTIYRGQLVAADEEGFVVRQDNGSFSPRTDWAKLTDESLSRLANDERARPFVEIFIAPPEPVERPAARPIRTNPQPRAERPDDVGKGWLKALTTPGGLFLLGVLFLVNLFVGYQVALFKWQPTPLVCGLSAVLPVIGPIIFLVMPKNVPEEEVSATEEAVAQAVLNVADSGPSMVQQMGLRTGSKKGGEDSEYPKVFKRGEFTFNRRFFETQFPTFFRVVTSEADKNLVLELDCARGIVLANRISRISQNEVHVKTTSGDERPIEFAGINQVTLRVKDEA